MSMTTLYEKDVTLQLIIQIQVQDDPLTQMPSYITTDEGDWKRQMEEQYRLLQALLQQEQTDLPQVLLVQIAWHLGMVNDAEWEEVVARHLGISDLSFCRGRLFSRTIATLSKEDQDLWNELIDSGDPDLGNLFHLCTEDLDRCFRIRLKQAVLQTK
jgi:hypothetical protein